MQISPIPRSAHEHARRCYWLPRCDAHCVPDRQRHSIRNCGRRLGNHLPARIPEEGCLVGPPNRNCGRRQLPPIAMRARSLCPTYPCPSPFILASEPASMHAPGPGSPPRTIHVAATDVPDETSCWEGAPRSAPSMDCGGARRRRDARVPEGPKGCCGNSKLPPEVL